MSTSSDTPVTMAPELDVTEWFNTGEPIRLADLRGKVVVLHAFQMLCPGCVSHGLPQARVVHETFPASDVAVIGLHTVFEHHEVMGPAALRVFLHEYRIRFPVAVDRPGIDGPIPMTMRAYGMEGTPSVVLIDREGVVRLHHFGRLDDLQMGARIGELVAARPGRDHQLVEQGAQDAAAACTDSGCSVRR